MAQDQLKTAFDAMMERVAAFQESDKRAAEEAERRRRKDAAMREEARNDLAQEMLAKALHEAQPLPRAQDVFQTTLVALIDPFARNLDNFEDYLRRMRAILEARYPTLVLVNITLPDGTALTKEEEYVVFENACSDMSGGDVTRKRTVWAVAKDDDRSWQVTFRVVQTKQ